ncbi:hypothetical protein BCR33DRAFT_172533 [Rhizoclosmatium globosum]|uniref:Uncharacterized protein n=1 Tax=Rhizoclosmatium globosum TaxID=329046 RepID=A0A1Y2CH76_9FUNG|nr:hypothetical protein BCR33DRAFT_172533 [Rhizoclosmatium globosum]|eukprot:ORY45665.1 hypothetical protein BCR33DRAFT_172533 [Rhizoclosmatium globosum]
MVLHMRSLVVEAGWGSENHVMFLVHHKSNQTLSQTEKNTILLLSNIPTEFHSLCHVFTDGEMKAEYSGYSEQRFHPHITFAHVMRLHPKYELVWFIEEDVRYTGRWPTLFRDVELFANNQGLQQVPDFVSFEDICEPTSDWVYSKECEHVFDRQTQRHSLGVVWGWSQNLAKALIDRLKKDDQNCYYEVFPPSVAKNASLNSLFVPHSLSLKKGIVKTGVVCQHARSLLLVRSQFQEDGLSMMA